jgi:hypothetical protein
MNFFLEEVSAELPLLYNLARVCSRPVSLLTELELKRDMQKRFKNPGNTKLYQ